MSPSARPKTTESKKKRTTSAATLAIETAHDSPRVAASDIALKAFSFYCERGCQHGSDLDDWLRAERELLGGPAAKPAGRRGAR